MSTDLILQNSNLKAKYLYLTLLRGINVGGNNIIKMTDLITLFEKMGFTEIVTYIQSGNVIFKSDEEDTSIVTNNIEHLLSERFNLEWRTVTIKHQQLKTVVNEAPQGFGEDADKYRYVVLFLKESLTTDVVMKKISTKNGIDKAYTGECVLYFSQLKSRASQSHLTRIIKLPLYSEITIRNWTTVSALLGLMEKNAAISTGKF
jgi:uncharacterized protein (DUF1697 family)